MQTVQTGCYQGPGEQEWGGVAHAYGVSFGGLMKTF